MKLTEKQKALLATILEGTLYIGGILFGVAIIAFGLSMIWTVLRSLF